MSCMYNNGQGCNRCPYFVKTISIVAEGSDTLTLTIPAFTKDLYNKDKICICVAQAIPEEAMAAQQIIVEIEGGGGKLPLVTHCGNFVHGDQIRSRRVYHTTLATDTEALMVSCRELCRTNYTFPVIEPPAPPAKINKPNKNKKQGE